ncbi:MAG: alpha/beta fold hydrolase, partial [Deltaproteobacteria bacterium]|nr:alpha/beta fold hydrolase [Deltaproteobacteria bacterium]
RVPPSADPGANRGALVIAGGTGVLRRFYAPFATWLATEGFTVVTFDYRGIGGSRAVEAGLAPTLRAWGELDLAGVLSWTADVYGGGEVGLVGHSVGGQLVGLLPESVHARTTSIVTIASQSGDYRLWPMPMRLAMAALWWGIVPGVTRAIGYLPGSLGIGQDLPAGVALEWAEWCRTPGYLVGVDDDDTSERRRSGFARVRVPLLAFSFHDDTYAPPAAVDALLDLYTSADVRRRHLDRSDGRFGHFGFFRSRHRALWREISAHFQASRAGDR